LAALVNDAERLGINCSITKAVLWANSEQRERFLQKILQVYPSLQNKRVALVGLAFKSGTDDLRDSPALWLADQLCAQGAKVVAFDSLQKGPINLPNLRLAQDFKELFEQDFLVIANNETFLQTLPLKWFLQLRDRCIFDARTCFKPSFFAGSGIEYYSVGRRLIK
jgi:UDPglucose 6-dehydrogenase